MITKKMNDNNSPKNTHARLLNRRQVIHMGAAGLLGLAGLAALEKRTGIIFAQGQGGIVATPALTEGPYFVDEMLNRSDIRLDPADGSLRQGLPLQLAITVSQINNGVISPLPGAYVDLWQCDALGRYSDVARENTAGQKYLRGYQVTNAHGNVRFLTIYPGWYQGRTVHIHSKVRQFMGSEQTYEFSTQFFFDEAITSQVYNTVSPYNTRPVPSTTNSTDGIYRGGSNNGVTQSDSGALLLLRLAADASHAIASFHYVLDLAAGSFPGDGGPDGDPNPGPGGPPPGNPPPGGPPPPRA